MPVSCRFVHAALNHKNQAVVDYFGEITCFWLDLDSDGDYSDGIDGFRVDNVNLSTARVPPSLRRLSNPLTLTRCGWE